MSLAGGRMGDNSKDESSDGRSVITGGPLKYYNKRKFRRSLTSRVDFTPSEPISQEWYRSIIQQISSARKSKNISQRSLAEMVGSNQAEISRLENGKTNPTVGLLVRIFTALDLEISLNIKK